MLTKTTDNKGRVTLGANFANKTVIINEIDEMEVVITVARVMPAREAWLYENPVAKKAVFEGLEQAKAGMVAENPPDLAADKALADQLDGTA